MSLITKSNIEIRYHYVEKKMKSGLVKIKFLTDEEAKAKLDNPQEKDTVKILNTTWTTLSWKKANELTQVATDADGNFNNLKYRDLSIKTCLLSWDLKDDQGRDVPFNHKNFDELPDYVAMEIYTKYSEYINKDEEEEKKA